MIFQCGLNMVHTQWIFIGFEAILKKNSELWREKPYFFLAGYRTFYKKLCCLVWGWGGGMFCLTQIDKLRSMKKTTNTNCLGFT